MLISRTADNPSGHGNHHVERAGGSGHATVECDERRTEAPDDGDVQRIGGHQSEIEPPQVGGRRPDIAGIELGPLGRTRGPNLEVGEVSPRVLDGSFPGTDASRNRRYKFGGGEIADDQALRIVLQEVNRALTQRLRVNSATMMLASR
jgi:hypothetical protein